MVKTIENINENVIYLINICKSSSKTSGSKLRSAHYQLGKIMGNQILKQNNLNGMNIAIVIMMRAGLPFGLGIADELDDKCNVQLLFDTINKIDEEKYDYLIFADAVINTGKTITDLSSKVKKEKVIIATNVISGKYLYNFNEYNVYASRVSSNSYKGSSEKEIIQGKGPDTGDRLFNNNFYK